MQFWSSCAFTEVMCLWSGGRMLGPEPGMGLRYGGGGGSIVFLT